MHPAEKTEPLRSFWIELTHWSSEDNLTSTILARPSSTGARSVFATYSIWTSHENKAELWAGNVFGPKLETSVSNSTQLRHRQQPAGFLQDAKIREIMDESAHVGLSSAAFIPLVVEALSACSNDLHWC